MKRIDAGYAALAIESSDVPTEDSTLVSGVAIGEDDVTNGRSDKQTLWPKDVLKEAAESLTGQPLATDMDHTADDPQPQTPVEAIVGEITDAGYVDGVGVVFEAELDDESLAKKVKNGRLEVSPLVARDVEPLASEKADFKATSINRWRDVALVANGAAPSNQIQVGDSPVTAEALHEALQEDIDLTPPEAAQNHAQDVLDWRADEDKDVQGMQETGWNRAEQLASGEELSPSDIQEIFAWFARHGEDEWELDEEGMDPWQDNGRVAIKGWGGPSMRDWVGPKRRRLAEMGELEPLQAYAPDAVEALKEVAGVSFEGTADGKLDESEIPSEGYESHYLYPGETKSESSYPVVDADGNLRKGNVDAAWGLGARGDADDETHDERLLALAQEFDSPPEWAMEDNEAMADVEDVSEDTLVRWNSSGDRDAFGRIVDIRVEGDEPLDGEIDGEQTITPPAALIEVHRPTEDGWEATDQMVGHKLDTDTLTVIDELPNPESLAKHEENMADVPEEFQFDNPGAAMSKAEEMGLEEIHTHGEGEETVFMPGESHSALMDELEGGDTQSDDETDEAMSQSSVAGSDSGLTINSTMDDETINAVVDAAENLENPVGGLESLAAADNPTVVEQETYTSMRGVLEEALSEKADLKNETIEALSFNALVDEFRDDDGELVAEALVQTPETGQPSGDGVEALSDDADVEKAEALYADYQQFGMEALKSDIQDALGVSDWDDAQEVLD